MVSNRSPLSLNLIFGNRKKSQGAKSGNYGGWGMTAIISFARNCWVRRCERDVVMVKLRHGAGPILSSEPVGMSRNQFPPPQQCREWSDFDPDERALEFVQQFQELCSLWVSLCFRHRQQMCDRAWTRHAIETPAYEWIFGSRRLVESSWVSP
jgi:hypothetical protein